ncbi:hypothetical protein VTO42DRAFT_4148 [Malbranchea cinnamomea]
MEVNTNAVLFRPLPLPLWLLRADTQLPSSTRQFNIRLFATVAPANWSDIIAILRKQHEDSWGSFCRLPEGLRLDATGNLWEN